MVRLLLVALVSLAVLGAAEVTLDLPDPLVPGVVLDGAIEVNDPPADITRVELPAVEGLEWQLSRRNSSQTRVVNGQQSAVVSIGLRVRAAKVGTLQLPAVAVHCANKTVLRSAPRAVRVDHGDASLVGDGVASCRFEPATIVPGQPTTLIYRLCLRRGQVAKLGVNPPEGAISLGERTVDDKGRAIDAQGGEWKVVTVTWPITHATPGSYPVSGQQEIQIPIGDGFFDNRVQRKQIAIPSATLTVEPLPAEGRPADYYGLIGPLEAVALLDRERVAAGEGTVLALTVKGRQTELVKRPALAVAGAQVYAKDESTAEGGRTFRWDVVPAQPGTVAIPALRLPYFDPASRGYRTADSAALTLVVVPGRNRDLGIVGAAPTAAAAAPAPAAPAIPALP
ncbi:MAG: BatD family protein, partial [Planctomycetes bacterium]|nr:BatD family protein [Planctomycetota bacterium]